MKIMFVLLLFLILLNYVMIVNYSIDFIDKMDIMLLALIVIYFVMTNLFAFCGCCMFNAKPGAVNLTLEMFVIVYSNMILIFFYRTSMVLDIDLAKIYRESHLYEKVLLVCFLISFIMIPFTILLMGIMRQIQVKTKVKELEDLIDKNNITGNDLQEMIQGERMINDFNND